jgi:D-3-phosphoglycerate dehydrogenase
LGPGAALGLGGDGTIRERPPAARRLDLTDPLERWRQGWRGTKQIVVTRPDAALADESRAVLEAAGCQLVLTTLRDEQGRLRDEVCQAEVLISGGEPIDAETFGALRRARFLLRPYVGYDDIDVEAASQQGILVANVPDTFIEEVANHTLALLLAHNRRLAQMDRFVRDGRWAAGQAARQVGHPIRRLSTMALGLIGFGNIGRLVAQRAAPFGFRLLACDPYVQAGVAAEYGVELLPMDEVLRQSDLLSIHVFLSGATRHLIDARALSLMKPTAVLINTSRGPVVDEPALIEALESGRLAGAALDVFEQEPLDPASPLTRLHQVILAPHLASYSDEGDALHRERVGQLALQGARGLPERKVVIDKALYDRLAALPELAGVPRH